MSAEAPIDFYREVRRSIAAQWLVIERRAWEAVQRLNWMHAVGSRLCGCGSGMPDHSGWDNHAPTEIPMDKSHGLPTDECPHDDWLSRRIGTVVRFSCHDCGETSDRYPEYEGAS